jgi:hypothetical protein
MALDWDGLLLGPVMDIFGEGQAGMPATWPTYIPKGGIPFQLRGAVYDEEYRRVVDLGDGTTDTSSHPVLGVRDAVFAERGIEPGVGGLAIIPAAGRTLAVIDVQPDGHGHTLLILAEAA